MGSDTSQIFCVDHQSLWLVCSALSSLSLYNIASVLKLLCRCRASMWHPHLLDHMWSYVALRAIILNIYCQWFWKRFHIHPLRALDNWNFFCSIKTIIPQIIYYALSHVFCCVLCLAGVHCGQRGSSVGRYSWSGRVSRPEDTGSFFSTNNSTIINNVLKFDLRDVNNNTS